MIIKSNGYSREIRYFIIVVRNEYGFFESFFNGEQFLHEVELNCLFSTYEEAEEIAKNYSSEVVSIVPVNVAIRELENP
ncbi:MAG: hypothetical protein J1G30_01265 [Spirochaetales bacterium]|nr:hypothetical protein [Spirochaetales bacterium]